METYALLSKTNVKTNVKQTLMTVKALTKGIYEGKAADSDSAISWVRILPPQPNQTS